MRFIECPTCHGEAYDVCVRLRCPTCKGTGVVQDHREPDPIAEPDEDYSPLGDVDSIPY